MLTNNLLKLWKQILKLSEVETDKGKLIVESEIAEGVEVFVENEGEFVPAPEGEYVAEDKIIVVAEGKIAEIRVKEEAKPEETQEEVQQEEEQEPVQPDEKDARIAELEDKQTELEALLAEKDARIAELEAQLAEKQKELEMSSEKPAKEAVKHDNSGALKYFN